MATGIRFFRTRSEFRNWLKRNHRNTRELWVGFYRKASGRASITWPESVEEALCVGWIDGLRKTVDAESYKIRFTPRRPTSNWSAVNIARVQELIRMGRMRPAGTEAFRRRQETRSVIYSYEDRKSAVFDAAAEKTFRARRNAWNFFEKLPKSYRQTVTWWVMSAKKDETRRRRLEKLIKACQEQRRLYS